MRFVVGTGFMPLQEHGNILYEHCCVLGRGLCRCKTMAISYMSIVVCWGGVYAVARTWQYLIWALLCVGAGFMPLQEHGNILYEHCCVLGRGLCRCKNMAISYMSIVVCWGGVYAVARTRQSLIWALLWGREWVDVARLPHLRSECFKVEWYWNITFH